MVGKIIANGAQNVSKKMPEGGDGQQARRSPNFRIDFMISFVKIQE